MESVMKMKVLRPNFEKYAGLVDVIVQCGITGRILMKGTANEAAYRLTLETGLTYLFSRSRQELWCKGMTSGNFQRVLCVRVDCDGDAIIYVVVQTGARVACHTDALTCFYRDVLGRDLGIPAPKAGDKEVLQTMEVEVSEKLLPITGLGSSSGDVYFPWSLSRLEFIMKRSAKKTDGSSYTRTLLDKGVNGCAKKFGEEAVELTIAAASENDERVVKESADVIFHLLAVLQSRGLSVSLVEDELERREAKSGLQEKASRQS